MSPSSTNHRPVRIAGCSGGFTDRVRAITSLAGDSDVDAVIGDWLSEMTMTMHGSGKIRALKAAEGSKTQLSLEERKETAMYAETFLQCFEPAIDNLVKNKCKLVVNAGASDTELLTQVCDKMVWDKRQTLNFAWVEGDDVTPQVNSLIAKGERFESLVHGKNLEEWGVEPICAQAYMGGLGIAEALKRGADVVICVRVADAAPWKADQFDELAGALVAGHLIECSAYVTGGYCSGFKDLLKAGKHVNMGFPITEIDYKGECVTSQLVYEIQGPWYFNCDVTADISDVRVEQIGVDKVRITGVKGMPPPPTTKVGIAAPAGFQAEWHIYLCGLDMVEKCKITEDQIRYTIGEDISKFYLLKFHQNGSSSIDAKNQDLATVDFRIFAQSPDPELLRPDIPNGFNRWLLEVFLQSAPGASLSNDWRQTVPKPHYEYWVSLLPQTELDHRVHCLFGDKCIVEMDAPKITKTYPRQQPSYEASDPVDVFFFGKTVRAPLGFMTIDRVQALLGPEEYKGKPIDRFEIPGVRAVHFLLHDHLDRGYNACSNYDTLGKLAGEYMRAKTVDLPKKFLDRGRIQGQV
ncbi:hypothetical protein BJ170DRAFT_700187 [Xylariales sp. AK1849]|nr:hypothetical protein BJ170DRAFT_700187 [Xylariales sp. AK1849]